LYLPSVLTDGLHGSFALPGKCWNITSNQVTAPLQTFALLSSLNIRASTSRTYSPTSAHLPLRMRVGAGLRTITTTLARTAPQSAHRSAGSLVGSHCPPVSFFGGWPALPHYTWGMRATNFGAKAPGPKMGVHFSIPFLGPPILGSVQVIR
jgi:hypothetical protein